VVEQKRRRRGVFDDELYDVLAPTRGGYGRLQDFGIRFGNERVVLHIEPSPPPAPSSSASFSGIAFDRYRTGRPKPPYSIPSRPPQLSANASARAAAYVP
jgi:hypothetical protein